jgi:hypothetical protein
MTPLVDARRIGRDKASAHCQFCGATHTYNIAGKTGPILFCRTACRVKRALDAYGSPRVIALRFV